MSHKKTIIKKRLEIVFDLRQKFETFIRSSTISSVDVYGHRQQDIFEVLFRVGLKIYTVCSTGHDIELRLKIFWTCVFCGQVIMFISSCLLGHPEPRAGLRPAFYHVTYSQHICVEGILH